MSKCEARCSSGRVSWDMRGAYIDTFVGEAWWDSRALFFGLAQQDRELLDGRHGNVSPVVARQKGLSTC